MSPTPGHVRPRRPRPRPTAGRRPTRRSRPATALDPRRSSGSTSTPPPPRRRSRRRLLAAGRFEAPLSEYPPTDYRRLVEAAAARYGVDPAELLVGAGADEILDIVAKVFIPAGGRAVVPIPTYAMYRVLTEQRGATRRRRPAARPRSGLRARPRRDRAAAATPGAAVVWLCSPNNPTALAEPDGAIATLLAGLAADAAAAGRPAPDRRPRRGLRRVRRVVAPRAARRRTRTSSSSGPPARPTPWPVCGSGSRSPGPSSSPGSTRSAAGLGLDRLGHARHRGAPRPGDPRGQPRPRRRRARPPDRRAARRRLVRSARRSRTSSSSTSAPPSARRPSPRGSCRAASCRARSAPAIRSPTTCA